MLSSATLNTESLERIKASLGIECEEVRVQGGAVTDPTSSSKVDVSRGGLMFGNENGQQNCILSA